MSLDDDRRQYVDAFYWSHGPCCAGCDWWRYLNTVAGQCIRHAPHAEGHPITNRQDHCGDFEDTFDWSSLPLMYRKRVGASPTEEGGR